MKGMPQFRDEIRRVIRRAANWSRGTGTAPRRPDVRFPTPEQLEAALAGSKCVSIDVETASDGHGGYDQEKITICGIAPRELNRAYVVPWTDEYIGIITDVLQSREILKVGHNFAYDMRAFRAYGIEPAWPVVDTIQAGALLWPPQPRSRAVSGAGDVRWLALAACVLRVVDGVPYWKEPSTPAARAIYRTAWPDIPDHLHGMLYCALDAYYTGLLWEAEAELLTEQQMMKLFREIVAPAGLVLSKLESRGMLIDPELRDHLYTETEQHIWTLTEKVEAFAAERHTGRLVAIQKAIDGIAAPILSCGLHPDYTGATKRSKCECCKGVYEANRPVRARMRAGLTKLKSIGERFKTGSDAHWRWLLFTSLGLKPVSVTKKTHLPQVDDESIEKLARRHPELEVLKWRVEIQHARHRLSGPLSLEADANNRVHFAYSLHRTAGRVASGADAEDTDKLRASPGNAMNLSDRDRRIFIAPPGYKLLQADWSQAEMRVEAWLAGERAMLQAWRDGADIHSFNALDIARALGRTEVTLSTVRTATFTFMGDQRSFRDAGKRLGLGLIYGMGPAKMCKLYGMPLPACEAFVAAFFKRWPRIHAFQQALIADAERERVVVNVFGRRLPIRMKWSDREGRWEAENREAVLAYPGQTTVAEMIKAVLPAAEALMPDALDTTTHDSLRFTIPADAVEACAVPIRAVMEREWPELGEIAGFGKFRCPVDIAVGQNWGKWDAMENPNGLKEVK